jgi:hypothetical protein
MIERTPKKIGAAKEKLGKNVVDRKELCLQDQEQQGF